MAAAGTKSDSGAGRRGWGHCAALAAVLGLGLALRVIALRWGLPDETHLFSYHPDEYHSLRGVLSVAAGDPNPHFFNYGSLYLYLVAAGCVALHPGHLLCEDLWVPGGPALPEALRDWTLDARLVTVLLGVLTIWVTYAIGRRIWGHRAGLVAALALAVMPLHVVQSHYATVDVPMTFFVALTLLLSVRVVEEPTWRNLAWAGVAAGLAASVKYSGAICLVAPATAWIIALVRGRRGESQRPPALAPVILLVAPLVAFAVTSPYTFLDWQNAWRDISFEMQHMRAGDDAWALALAPNGWLFHLRQLGFGVGWLLLVGALLGVVASVGGRPASGEQAGGTTGNRPDSGSTFAEATADKPGSPDGKRRSDSRWQLLPLIAFGIAFFGVMGAAKVRYARYEVALLPVIALCAASFADSTRTRGRLRAAHAVIVGLGMAWALLVSGLYLHGMAVEQPRARALAAIEQEVPEDARLGLVSEPWFHTPPVDYCNGGRVLRNNSLWRRYRWPVRELVITGLEASTVRSAGPEAFLLTDFDLDSRLECEDPAAREFVAALRWGYEPVWASEPGTRALLFGGREGASGLGRALRLGLPPSRPAQDWLYPFPRFALARRVVRIAPGDAPVQ